MGVEIGFESDHRVEKSGLVGEAHGLGGIEGGPGGDAAEGLQARRGGGHCRFGATGLAGEI